MTTGDEPMLPHPADDNAPMISGRGTKIIADARGAYLARNINALIDAMNEQQRLQFQNELWLQSATVMQTLLHTLKLDEADFHPIFGPLRQLLVAPDKETTARVLEILDPYIESGFINEPDEKVQPLILPSMAFTNLVMFMSDPKSAADSFLLLGTTVIERVSREHLTLGQTRDFTKQWLCDAAWNILQGKPAPRFELPS